MCKQGTEKPIKLSDGKIKSCDECIQPIVQLFNDYGLQTTASCCGHKKQNGSIILKDGREILIIENYDDARMIEGLFPPLQPRPNEWKHTIKRVIARFFLDKNK